MLSVSPVLFELYACKTKCMNKCTWDCHLFEVLWGSLKNYCVVFSLKKPNYLIHSIKYSIWHISSWLPRKPCIVVQREKEEENFWGFYNTAGSWYSKINLSCISWSRIASAIKSIISDVLLGLFSESYRIKLNLFSACWRMELQNPWDSPFRLEGD